MSLTTSSVTPLVIQTTRNYSDDHSRVIVPNSYETVIREPSPRIVRRYIKPSKPKYRYTIEQVVLLFSLYHLSVLFRKENLIVVVNGVVIGVHANVQCVNVVIGYSPVHFCFTFSVDYYCFLYSLHC